MAQVESQNGEISPEAECKMDVFPLDANLYEWSFWHDQEQIRGTEFKLTNGDVL